LSALCLEQYDIGTDEIVAAAALKMYLQGLSPELAERILSDAVKPTICGNRNSTFVQWIPHCGGKRKLSYRIQGRSYPKQRLVNFNLCDAYELHEGRLAEPERL
jgi:hypothetical protein